MPNETRGRFDTEIDRAVRGMMNVDPSPGMRQRVGERLGKDAPARWLHAPWGIPAFAAAVVLLALATAVALFRPSIADAPVAPQLAAGPAAVTQPLPDDLGVRTPAPSLEAEGSRGAPQPRTGGSESIFGAPTQMVSAASLPGGQAAAAQESKPADKPAGPPNADQPINIKLDLSITDQVGTGDPVKKTMSMIVADGLSGTIRNSGSVKDQGDVRIRVEARPKILPSGQIRLMLALEYVPRAGGDARLEASALHEQISTIIEPGKPVVVTQSADPASDRRILVEVRATLIK